MGRLDDRQPFEEAWRGERRVKQPAFLVEMQQVGAELFTHPERAFAIEDKGLNVHVGAGQEPVGGKLPGNKEGHQGRGVAQLDEIIHCDFASAASDRFGVGCNLIDAQQIVEAIVFAAKAVVGEHIVAAAHRSKLDAAEALHRLGREAGPGCLAAVAVELPRRRTRRKGVGGKDGVTNQLGQGFLLLLEAAGRGRGQQPKARREECKPEGKREEHLIEPALFLLHPWVKLAWEHGILLSHDDSGIRNKRV